MDSLHLPRASAPHPISRGSPIGRQIDLASDGEAGRRHRHALPFEEQLMREELANYHISTSTPTRSPRR